MVLDVVVAGWIVSIWFVLWAFADMSRIPRRIWFWSGYHRQPWRAGLVVAFLAGGWPAVVVAFCWWRSDARGVLREELGEVRARHQGTGAA